MARQEQLEIISPSGDVKFLKLDPAKGIVNIGRHPENDVVLEHPRVVPFHAVLDFRQKPYRVMSLESDGDLVVGSERLASNSPREIGPWDSFQLCGYSFILYEGEGVAVNTGTGVVSVSSSTRPMPVEGATLPVMAPEAAAPAPFNEPAQATGLVSQPQGMFPRLTMIPPDHDSPLIVTHLPLREFGLTVGQTAICPLTITNGGAQTASFDVTVEGLDPDWVVITPSVVKLNKGERAAVNIALTPPRLPTTQAGNHFFLVKVCSPDYAGQDSTKVAALAISPYYEFAVGELSPRNQSISYAQREGTAVLRIINKGNSEAGYRLDADDDQRACSYEFTVPGNATSLTRQAEVRLPPNMSINVPIRITPDRRHIFGLRKRSLSVTVTTTPLEGQHSPRSVLSHVDVAPLIGPWTALVALAVLTMLALWIFRPTVQDFKTDKSVVLAKQPVLLSWRASPFAELRIDNGIGSVAGPQGSIEVVPKDTTTTYHLTAENFLSRLMPAWYSTPKDVTVNVGAVLPAVQLSVLMPSGQRVPAGSGAVPPVLRGEAITLYWDVEEADFVILTSNGAPETIQPAEYVGKRTLTPDIDTVYTLEGKNKYGPVNQSLTIRVNAPPTVTPTPSPTAPPVTILRFDVSPLVITAGGSIRLDWEVINVDHVQIQGVQGGNGIFPPKGSLEQRPDKDTVFVLIPGDGVNLQPQQRQVKVAPLPPTETPTATPIPPRIEAFTAAPSSVIRGSAEANAVRLSWLVSGAYNDITLSGNSFPTQSGLPLSGSITVAVSAYTNFILSVTLGNQVTTQSANVTVLEPTPTATPTRTPTPTRTLPPPPRIQYFRLAGATNPSDVIQTGASGNTFYYDVIAGSVVHFTWATQYADKVKFQGADFQAADEPPEGFIDIQINQQPTVPYAVTALNSVGQQVLAFISVTVKPRPATATATPTASSPAPPTSTSTRTVTPTPSATRTATSVPTAAH